MGLSGNLSYNISVPADQLLGGHQVLASLFPFSRHWIENFKTVFKIRLHTDARPYLKRNIELFLTGEKLSLYFLNSLLHL